MDLNLTQDQQDVGAAVRDFCMKAMPSEQRDARRAQAFQRDHWQDMHALGVATLELDAARGGGGLGLTETHVAVAELGRALLAGHVLELSWRPLAVLRRLQGDAQIGEAVSALAERGARWGLAKAPTQTRPAFQATRQADGGWLLDGRLEIFPGIDVCEQILVWARQDGDADSLLLRLPRLAFGDTQETEALDGDRLGTLMAQSLHIAPEQMIARGASVDSAVQATDEAFSALLAVEIGAIVSELLEMCLQFVQTRRQFGRPIGDFQALQHQLADFYLEAERTVSLARLAVAALDDAQQADAGAWVSAAAQVAGTNSRLLGERAIQLHGAMGFTDECRVAHLVRRALAATARLGSPSHHLDRFNLLRTRSELLESPT